VVVRFIFRRKEMAMRHAPVIELSGEQKQQLERWARSRKSPLRLVQRSKLIHLVAQGNAAGFNVATGMYIYQI
jgi:hypothetical protein